MRVAIDAQLAPGLSGGVAQWVMGLAGALSSNPDSVDRFFFIVQEGTGKWLRPYLTGPCELLEIPRSRISRVGVYLPFLRPLWRRLKTLRDPGDGLPASLDWLFDLHDIDIVHFPHQVAYPTVRPYIYQPWDLQHLHLPEFFDQVTFDRREAMYRAGVAGAALVMVASRWTKQDIVNHYGVSDEVMAIVNVPPVTLIYPSATSADIAAVREKYRLPAQFFLYPAQTYPHKNHLGLVRAVAHARRRGVRIAVVCSGNQTEHYSAVLDLCRELGVADELTFTGFVDSAELQALYAGAAALVFPSLFEGWGLPVFEAFAHGLPVVCSNATLLPELVGDAALVVDARDPSALGDALVQLSVDDGLRSRLAALGRIRVREFRWQDTARTMVAHYRQVAGEPLSLSDTEALATPPLV